MERNKSIAFIENKSMEIGISLYLSTGKKRNEEMIQKAHASGIQYAFTSLHIPEETGINYQQEVSELFILCQRYHLTLLIDVSPRTLIKLGYSSFEELKKRTSITHLRLDYGFSYEEVKELSKHFIIVYNASTLTMIDINALQKIGVDFSRFIACHNYYPKPFTGLSLQSVKIINQHWRQLGMKTMGFVAGDKEMRGPLLLGLPTVEKHRHGDVLENILELNIQGDTDVCFIGDIDVKEKTWQQLQQLVKGYITLRCHVNQEYQFILNTIHHDRFDSSEYVIRSQESREYASQGKIIPASLLTTIETGSICISNEKYSRYSGELEIARKNLGENERINVIGYINAEDIRYLPYITKGMGFYLQNDKKK